MDSNWFPLICFLEFAVTITAGARESRKLRAAESPGWKFRSLVNAIISFFFDDSLHHAVEVYAIKSVKLMLAAPANNST